MVHRVQKFIPKVQPEFFSKKGTAGIRTPIITPEGKFLSDVLELSSDHSFHIVNYNSPGATGAPAYSAYLINTLKEKGFLDYPLKSKNSFWDFEEILDKF